MYCSRCGNYVYDNTQVCPYCGNLTANYTYTYGNITPQVSQPMYYIPVNTPQPVQQVQTVQQVQRVQPAKQTCVQQTSSSNGKILTNASAIVGFVLSFFGLLSILGLIFSVIGLSNSKKKVYDYKGGGFSVAGIIISVISIILVIVAIALWSAIFIELIGMISSGT